jgi:hypothetical protein
LVRADGFGAGFGVGVLRPEALGTEALRGDFFFFLAGESALRLPPRIPAAFPDLRFAMTFSRAIEERES